MTGKELQKVMDDNGISLTLVKIRIQCILERTVAMIAIRQWIRNDAILPPRITQVALTHGHENLPDVPPPKKYERAIPSSPFKGFS